MFTVHYIVIDNTLLITELTPVILFSIGTSGVDNPDLTVCEAAQHCASRFLYLPLAVWQKDDLRVK